MSNRFPLQTVFDLMRTRADDAAKNLGRLISTEEDAKSRFSLLENYRNEYAQRFRTAAESGISPLQWANYQDFLGKLDDAINQQNQIVTESNKRTAEGRQHWLNEKGRVQAFDTLAKKHEANVRYQDEKNEQKKSDEFSVRKYNQSASDD